MNLEKLVAEAFMEAARLTPEQGGMLKLYLAIMRRLEEAIEDVGPYGTGDAGDAHAGAPLRDGWTRREHYEPREYPSEQPREAAALSESEAPALRDGAVDGRDPSAEGLRDDSRTGDGGTKREPAGEPCAEAASLAEYLESRQVNVSAAAEEMGVGPITLRAAIRGESKPKARVKMAIRKYLEARGAWSGDAPAAAGR